MHDLNNSNKQQKTLEHETCQKNSTMAGPHQK